ncbi:MULTISPECIES: RICIN domain-containing protein [Actinoplanes]|uniref:RICIN domain-containing protein n=1 Tax=Actinoplanes TaxID=1865 RepID=UPI0005F2963B|nr:MULTISPECIES: RICIN domain-containing protein [Actinoplanes]GLY04188.1 hypothetical protein Acsp01_45670 [Actinoplanes sp. NBRC 101535]
MRRFAIALATMAALFVAPAPASAAEDYWHSTLNWRSTKCLEQVWVSGAETTDVQVATCTGGDSQLWASTRVGTGYVVVTIKNKSGKCLEQSYVDGAETTTVKVAECTGATNQQWEIYQAEYYVTGYFLKNINSGKRLQQNYVNDVATPTVNVAAANVWGDYRNQIWR